MYYVHERSSYPESNQGQISSKAAVHFNEASPRHFAPNSQGRPRRDLQEIVKSVYESNGTDMGDFGLHFLR